MMVIVLRKLFKTTALSGTTLVVLNTTYNIQHHTAEKRKTPREENTAAAATKFTRRSLEHPIFSEAQCSFCDKPAGGVPLHDVSTFGLGERARKCALWPNWPNLVRGTWSLKRLNIILSAWFPCMPKQEIPNYQNNHGIALAELVCYIDETRADSEVRHCLKWQIWQICTATDFDSLEPTSLDGCIPPDWRTEY